MERVRAGFAPALALALALGAGAAWAGESPVGQPIEVHGMQIAGAYLQAVEMDPHLQGQESAKTDIHLEADIHALKDNPNGFGEDEWVPYLSIDYALTKKGSDWKAAGQLLPMVASDGPHYGANVRLDGPGQYSAVFTIKPPSTAGFLRHTDKETGVGGWWEPIEFKGDFKFVGTGKKGGY